MTYRDILSHFSLSVLPFGKEIAVEELLELPTIERALQSTRLLLDTRGIGLLIGKSGTGKSSILRKLCSTLHTGLFKPIYLCHTSIGLTEFYTHLCTGLGLPAGSRRSGMFRMLQERILSLNRSNRIHPVLFVDEAHRLNNEILQELRLLTNFEIDSFNALTVLLCAREEISLRFGLSSLEALANSITITIHLDSLPEQESLTYIEERIGKCGNTAPIFTPNAVKLIHQASGGIMRDINRIAHASMVQGYLSRSVQVEAEHVKIVIERKRFQEDSHELKE
jgi:type II secretory pathway predicted ATPase ExeA|tara:strand:+ start:2153 stop:2992 length:840 start_codon:yes stop_codon:yes gene_type:complete